jgi:phosphate transport system substrate-binding protein
VVPKKVLAVVLAVVIIVAAVAIILVKGPAAGTGTRIYVDQAGSETMYELCRKWAQDYMEINDLMTISVERGGSGPGLAALLNGTVDIAQASRPISAAERETAESRGLDIVELKVALDGIAIIVNPTNGVTNLTVEQLRGIYNGTLTNWEELGGADLPIQVYGRNDTSGTYVFFQEHVLENAPYTDTMVECDNYDFMIAEVNSPSHPGAIGYVGVGFVNNYPDVKIVPLKAADGSQAFLPSRDKVESFEYPLSRYLFFYLSEKPTGALLEYLEWVIDLDAGQVVVTEEGFYPIPRDVHDADMAALA